MAAAAVVMVVLPGGGVTGGVAMDVVGAERTNNACKTKASVFHAKVVILQRYSIPYYFHTCINSC